MTVPDEAYEGVGVESSVERFNAGGAAGLPEYRRSEWASRPTLDSPVMFDRI